ncbi:tigger transposable element-derived protein 6-like [Dermacentor albipictus]|uniref:tigger transposable element-derived protein 6-like n=1 Tax=Dermacentor albipictus TaxID=60249 RepID=UPI0038FCB6F1
MAPPCRKFLSLKDKARILAAVASGEKKGDVAKKFEISPSSLSTILKSKEAIEQALASGTSAKRKKLTPSAHEDLDKAMYAWFVETRAKNIPISGNAVQQKALNYACLLGIDDFKASTGWLSRFKARHDIVGKTLSGESASADTGNASAWISTNVSTLLKDYAKCDIYNADKTGLFYEMLPSKTLEMKGQRCHGGKHSKKRVTVLLCANADGSDKRPPLVIGKSARPRCFKGNRSLPVKYVANSRSWMTRAIFSEWVASFDCDMRRQGRRVCLLLDNCSAHHILDVELTNVELKYFPPNCTSIIQPLDQGVIRSMKCAYRQRVMQRLLLNVETGRDTKLDLYMALQMMAAAWAATGRPVIANCFTHAGFKLGDPDIDSAEDAADCNGAVQPPADVIASWAALQGAGSVPSSVELDDFIDADVNVIAREELSDEDIIKSVRDDGGQSDDDEVPDLHPPATSRVLDAFDVIRNSVAVHDDDVAMQLLSECENRVMMLLGKKGKQSTLLDFWK